MSRMRSNLDWVGPMLPSRDDIPKRASLRITPALCHPFPEAAGPFCKRLLVEIRQKVCVLEIVHPSEPGPVHDLVDDEERDEKERLCAVVSVWETYA
jgi:hypothetical protein